MKKRNILITTFGIMFCLSSFAPGPEFGYFNKYCVTSAQNCAYSCANKFVSSGIRRLYKYNNMQQPFYHAAVSPNMFSSSRKISVDPILLSAATMTAVGGMYSFPLMILGGVGTMFLVDAKIEKEKKVSLNVIEREKRVTRNTENFLNDLGNDASEEERKELQKLREKLELVKRSENMITLLLRDDENSQKKLMEVLAGSDEEKAKELLTSKKKPLMHF